MPATFKLPGAMEYAPGFDMSTIPDAVLHSEVARRRGSKRKSYTGGVYWAKHNSKVNNCRCQKCMAKRAKENA
jgi:hypothetical protein